MGDGIDSGNMARKFSVDICLVFILHYKPIFFSVVQSYL